MRRHRHLRSRWRGQRLIPAEVWAAIAIIVIVLVATVAYEWGV